MALNIDAKHDPKALAKTFQETGRISIPNFLTPDDAEKLGETVAKCQLFKFKYNDGNKTVFVKPMDIREMSDRRTREMGNQIFNAAMSGAFQFAHYACPLDDENVLGRPKLEPFQEVVGFLSGKTMHDFLGAMTGEKLGSLQSEVQWHKTDSFQTTGDGRKKGENRALGFTLDVTRDWQADWGGLRLFKDTAGDITETIVPSFNRLTVFRVPMKQSISYVTGYAKGVMLSVSGWYMAN